MNTKEIKTWLKVRNNYLATEFVKKPIKHSNNNDAHCDIENGVLIFIRYPHMQESILSSMGLFFLLSLNENELLSEAVGILAQSRQT